MQNAHGPAPSVIEQPAHDDPHRFERKMQPGRLTDSHRGEAIRAVVLN